MSYYQETTSWGARGVLRNMVHGAYAEYVYLFLLSDQEGMQRKNQPQFEAIFMCLGGLTLGLRLTPTLFTGVGVLESSLQA